MLLPRFLFVETAEPIGDGAVLENLILVQVDDRTFRRVTGEELAMLFERYPRRMCSLRDQGSKETW